MLDVTSLMSPTIRDEVLALFEKHRKTPGAPFDDEHFLDYLLKVPNQTRAVYNSFSGLRRFNAFIDEVQLHFSVYFSVEDRDANYSLSKFIQRVEFLQTSRRSSLASLRNQLKRGFGWNVVVVLNFLVLVGLGAFHRNLVVAAFFVALAVLVNGGFLWSYLSDRSYNRQLLAQLTGSHSK